MPGFPATRWTVVVQAGDASHPDAAEALAHLCQVYWPSVYVYFRRKGADAAGAADLTQEFFARVIEKRYFDRAQRDRGSFRSFLLGCARNFFANERDRQSAQKRGGGTTLSLDTASVEGRYLLEPHHDLTPERVFEHQWAWSVVQQAMARLEADVRSAGRDRLFAECRDLLLGDAAESGYRALADRLGTTEGALKVQIHRLRKRLRELVLEEIQQTTLEGMDAESELRYLLGALSRPRM